MAVTTTPRFTLPQWGTGADTPSRTAFNDAFAKLDAAAARDLGAVGGTALPTGQPDGTYAQTVNGSYRQLYRRAGGAWQQVGGNTWAEPIYLRADAALGAGSLAYQVSHPNLSNPAVVQNWDGSMVRGGRLAVSDVNSGQPGAVHVGDTAAADLAALGRIYARTRANAERGIVAAAHASGAGMLYTAREPGGTDPWTVDPMGRMRAQAPAAFGAASLAAGVPVAAAPGSSDVTAADLYAAASKQALRILRAVGDTDPIASFGQDRITLGRSASWGSGRIDLISPDNRVTGPLSVSGAANLAALTATTIDASSLTASGTVRGGNLNATGGVTAEGGRIYTQSRSSGAEVLSRPPVQLSGSSPASLRQATCAIRDVALNGYVNPGEGTYDVSFAMAEDGWLRLDAVSLFTADTGSSNSIEPARFYVTFDIRSGSTLVESSPDHVITLTTDDTSRQVGGMQDHATVDIFSTRLSAGTYTCRIRWSRATVLGGRYNRVRLIFTPVVVHSIVAVP